MTLCPHCGLSDKLDRSQKDHARLMAIIGQAYQSWPEGHSFKPQNAQHLRKWLLVQTGHYTLVPLKQRGLDFTGRIELVSEICQELEAFPYIDLETEDVGIKKPHSMRFDRMSQRQFGPLRDAIEKLLAQELGCSLGSIKEAAA